ncbi:hypothetical protein BU23DRAFT_291892 [Bimuria novae-zelandiae CBS 107.79]|uniref:Uncharacterized protein n=1 Tax=Bimuria novae-zelandiae CBS 107.79 TaxID=1447943 RepID=A0A6A5UR02_9PLEO|nr:hypothetical protein BU23DRAFT_291892 [Bimuria novae-zelandiae CBS 107.79]
MFLSWSWLGWHSRNQNKDHLIVIGDLAPGYGNELRKSLLFDKHTARIKIEIEEGKLLDLTGAALSTPGLAKMLEPGARPSPTLIIEACIFPLVLGKADHGAGWELHPDPGTFGDLEFSMWLDGSGEAAPKDLVFVEGLVLGRFEDAIHVLIITKPQSVRTRVGIGMFDRSAVHYQPEQDLEEVYSNTMKKLKRRTIILG